MIRVAASLCSAASGATAATGAGMRQVTDSRKAAARYRAEYLRLSNTPTSAAATCDNTVRCACAGPPHSHHPSSLHSKRHWVRNQSRDLNAFYTRIRTFLLDTTVWLYPNHEVTSVNARMFLISKQTHFDDIPVYVLYIKNCQNKTFSNMRIEVLAKSFFASDAFENRRFMIVNRRLYSFCHKIKSISYAYFEALSSVKAPLSATFSVSS